MTATENVLLYLLWFLNVTEDQYVVIMVLYMLCAVFLNVGCKKDTENV